MIGLDRSATSSRTGSVVANLRPSTEHVSSNPRSLAYLPSAHRVLQGLHTLHDVHSPLQREGFDLIVQPKRSPQGIEKTGAQYWSTDQNYQYPFQTLDGFRRHENEREKYYVFLPHNLTEETSLGPGCALCLHLDPDDAHFEMHKVLHYVDNRRTIIKKTRKGDFKKLLRTHNVPDTHIDRLIRKWYHVEKKAGYSCGLCIKLLGSLLERTNHLAHDHYEKGQDRTTWDVNVLIKGLLLEPQVNQEYQKRFGVNPSSKDSHLTWDHFKAQRLQKRLELGQEKPWDLAQAAFELATRSEPSSRDQDNLGTGSNFSTPAVRHSRVEQNPDQQIGGQQTVSQPLTPPNFDTNNDQPFQEHGHAFYELGRLFGEPATSEDFMHPQVGYGVTDEEHGINIPLGLPASPLMDKTIVP